MENPRNVIFILFSGCELPDIWSSLDLPPSGALCVSSGNTAKINALIDDIFNDYKSESVSRHIGAVGIEADNYVYDKRSLIVKPVADYMNRNYRKLSPPFPQLLASLGMSRKELDALFSDIFSMTADEYYKHLRMENAKHLLFFYYTEGAEYTAKILGYKNAEDFNADFYGEFKITPDEFTALYH